MHTYTHAHILVLPPSLSSHIYIQAGRQTDRHTHTYIHTYIPTHTYRYRTKRERERERWEREKERGKELQQQNDQLKKVSVRLLSKQIQCIRHKNLNPIKYCTYIPIHEFR